jgi:hypothetical protein
MKKINLKAFMSQHINGLTIQAYVEQKHDLLIHCVLTKHALTILTTN